MTDHDTAQAAFDEAAKDLGINAPVSIRTLLSTIADATVRQAAAMERLAETQDQRLADIGIALSNLEVHLLDLIDAEPDTVAAETLQYQHATELAGRPMHSALRTAAPKGFICPACKHTANAHRQFGCDIISPGDDSICSCTAPYGRPPRDKPCTEPPTPGPNFP